MEKGLDRDAGPDDWQIRTRALLGDRAVERLQQARVYVFGAGAVGSYALEALARAGVGMMRVVDFDVIKPSNRNRQLYALSSTMGRGKAEVAAERLRDINPCLVVEAVAAFAHADTLPDLLAGRPDLVVDAIDSLNPKVELIAAAAERHLPVYSSLGAATRTDAGSLRFGPLFEAVGCPLGRLVRKRLRRRGIQAGDLWSVSSDQPRNRAAIRQPEEEPERGTHNQGRPRTVLGSLSTMTGMFGLRLAHEAVLRLVGRP